MKLKVKHLLSGIVINIYDNIRPQIEHCGILLFVIFLFYVIKFPILSFWTL